MCKGQVIEYYGHGSDTPKITAVDIEQYRPAIEPNLYLKFEIKK